MLGNNKSLTRHKDGELRAVAIHGDAADGRTGFKI